MTEKSASADHSGSDDPLRDAPRLSRLYLDALRAADAAGAYRVAARALQQGMAVPALYQRVITPAMHAIGDLWEKGAITVADEHLATALTHRVLAGLRPLDGDADGAEGRLALLAAVEGEEHALALRMVADILEDCGFRVVYLGANVPTDALVQAVSAMSPHLLALSATMPELSPMLQIAATRARSERPELEVLVGGQAVASRPAGESVAVIQDLEALPQRFAPPV